VGNWPAFSWASRAALSPASWVGSSFEWNVPDGGLTVVPPPLEVAGVELVVAALLTVGASSVAPIAPPPIIEVPTIATARSPLRVVFISKHVLCSVWLSSFGKPNTIVTARPVRGIGVVEDVCKLWLTTACAE